MMQSASEASIAAPFQRLRTAVLFLTLTLIGLWPAFLNGDPLLFYDSASYYKGGGAAIEMLEDKLGIDTQKTDREPTPEPTVSAPSESNPEDAVAEQLRPATADVTSRKFGLRSLPFSLYANVTTRLFGVFGPIALISALTAWLILAFVAILPTATRSLVALGTMGLSGLPFYTSQYMPDTLAGHLILAPIIMVVRTDLGAWTRLLLLATMAFAFLAHYAHIPLGAVMLLLLVGAYVVRRSYIWAGLSAATLLIALGVNVAISLLVPTVEPDRATSTQTAEAAPVEKPKSGKSISIAPARFPILLARTLEDGPGRKYLEATCPDPRFTLCEVYATFPKNVGAALWGDDSIYNRATPIQAQRIADEELELIWEAFKAYPVEQTTALLGNAFEQLYLIGLNDQIFGSMEVLGPRTIDVELEFHTYDSVKAAVEQIQLISVGLALLGLILRFGSFSQPFRQGVWFLAVGLLVNAAVCGGLSAPVDRYQGRVIWCLILMGFSAWALHPRLAGLNLRAAPQ
ncbi:hypothetical protein [Litoreibacter roseus]|uniref:Uncharacterized protein n=1 Tax=Litoreibacter roseus TaxID=2601869 RepID=A0A6N6JCF5_9RHOB|nr:hypothetical protein [Litoreibacter roseus]GFE63089.1 hypothetical protein KIN_01630 [Litoreibacter roseus]